MNRQRTRQAGAIFKRMPILVLLAMAVHMFGCEVDSFFDPSKVGRFEFTPTLVPILDRIDVIEGRGNFWGETSEVTSQDLLPSDLTYRLSPGDAVTVEIFELLVPQQVYAKTQRIDAAGNFRIPTLDDMPAAGLSAQEFQASIERALITRVSNPVVNVTVEEGLGFDYTVYGYVQQGGVYQLRRPDLRVLDALAIAGGLAPQVYKVYVIRRVPLTEGTQPFSGRGGDSPNRPRPIQPPVDIESLIQQLPGEKPDQKKEEPKTSPGVNPGAMRDDGELAPPEKLEPVRSIDEPPVDVEALTPGRPVPPPADASGNDSFIYIEERGEWVQVKSGKPGGGKSEAPGGEPTASGDKLFAQRVIEIPVERLKRGDSEYNIVVRPNDSIYVKEPPQGVVFVQGEVFRPGAFNLDPDDKLTLGRLLAAAGGFPPLAIPERVDLTRMLEGNREATVRVNVAAIYNRTEPDIYLKANDHIIVGTSFVAFPLAVFRSGFRATYGFGMVLDRNFGNDVFGAPPVNQFGQ